MDVKTKNNKKICGVIIFICIVTAICVSIFFINEGKRHSSGEATVKEKISQVHEFDGSYKDIVTAEDAVDVMNNVKVELGYSEDDAFRNTYEESIGKSTYYQMQQYYQDYPVWNKYVTLETSEQGELLAVIENKDDISIQTANKQVSEKEAQKCIEEKYGVEFEEDPEIQMVVYIDESGKSCLAYSFSVFGVSRDEEFIMREILVDTNKKQILKERDLIKYAESTEELKGSKYTFKNVPVEKNEDKILLRTKNIQTYKAKTTQNFKNGKLWDITDESKSLSEIADEVPAQEKKKIEKNSIDAYGNANIVIQFYREHFDVVDKLKFNVVTGFKTLKYSSAEKKLIEKDYTNNSFSGQWGDEELISFGPYKNRKYTLANSIDIVAHEMGHSVVRATNKLQNGVQAAALGEAYPDIFAVCTKNVKMLNENPNENWVIRSNYEIIRDIVEPSKTKAVSHLREYDASQDCHYNSTFISHAAYLMWKNGINLCDYNKLADLWYRSLEYLSAGTFADCKQAVYLAGVRMYEENELEYDDLTCIDNAFKEVGVDGEVKPPVLVVKIDEDAENYQWAVEPEIEADDIYYLASCPDYDYSVNELSMQADNPNAVIQKGNELGIIGVDGNLLTEVAYKEIANFGDRYMMIRTTPKYSEEYNTEWDHYWLVDDGEVKEGFGMGDASATLVYYYYEGVRQRTGDLGRDFVEKVIPVQEASVYHSYNTGLIMNNLSGKYALDRNCNLITDFVYDECGSCSDGLIAVCQNGKWGYVDEEGQIVIPLEYDASWTQYPVIKASYRSSADVKDYCYAASDGYVVLRQDEEWELRDICGNSVISKGVFEAIRPVFDGKCWVKKNGKWGVIQLKAETVEDAEKEENNTNVSMNYLEIYEPILEEIFNKSGGYAEYAENNTYFLYDIDKNDVKELVALQGTCNGNYMYQVYTIKNNQAEYLGEISGFSCSFYMDESGGKEKYIIRSEGHMGYTRVEYISIEDDQIRVEEVYSEETVDYYSNQYPINEAKITDVSLLD